MPLFSLLREDDFTGRAKRCLLFLVRMISPESLLFIIVTESRYENGEAVA